MNLSLQYRFLFVANIRSGSTSIEAVLRPISDIVIPQTSYGKHSPLGEIQKRFSYIFDVVPMRQFLVFGVIRDPVDLMLSIYNFHKKDDFDNQIQSTKGVTFDDFLKSFGSRKSWMLTPQHDRFRNAKGKIGVNYLIDFEKMPEQLREMFRDAYGIDLPLDVEHLNASPKTLDVETLTLDQIEKIRECYAEDVRILRQQTGVWLGARPEFDPEIGARLKAALQQQSAVREYRAECDSLRRRAKALEEELLVWRKRAMALERELGLERTGALDLTAQQG